MSGKIGYLVSWWDPWPQDCLNPFYVREDWLHGNIRSKQNHRVCLNPFYVREDWLLVAWLLFVTLWCLNPFYVREDWLQNELLSLYMKYFSLNPFYVREDWLPSRALDCIRSPGIVLIPFMSGKIGYPELPIRSVRPKVLIPFMSGKIGYLNGLVGKLIEKLS